MCANLCWPNGQSWKHYWPGGIVTFIAVLQLFVSFAVVALHIAIVTSGLVVTCVVFFVIEILFRLDCCNRSSVACATYVMITNVLAFIFAAVLISFDNKFINDQLLEASAMSSPSCIPPDENNVDMRPIFLGITKGQLAASVIMLVSSLLFIAIYIYVYIRAVLDKERRPNDAPRWVGQHAPNQTSGYGMSTQHTTPALPVQPVQTVHLKSNNARYDNQPELSDQLTKELGLELCRNTVRCGLLCELYDAKHLYYEGAFQAYLTLLRAIAALVPQNDVNALLGELLLDTHGDILNRNDIRQITMMMRQSYNGSQDTFPNMDCCTDYDWKSQGYKTACAIGVLFSSNQFYELMKSNSILGAQMAHKMLKNPDHSRWKWHELLSKYKQLISNNKSDT
ncbi:unnamed protein product [Rotaria magnacalcarata]|uniref:Uncharacterized protein n=1 Tax=Rotaria magnacalcarata TaxID=392030 RepID=A0A819W457_9BILA|nr:unnamed protein product [Rotaria magnacalcarata]CAF4117056.1 unnamed protein product [Rotaria magnacalcarata]